MSTVSLSTTYSPQNRRRKKRMRQARRRLTLLLAALGLSGLMGAVLTELGSALIEHFSPYSPSPAQIAPLSADEGQALPAEQDWRLTLINADHPLAEGYVPKLTEIDASGRRIDRRIAGELKRMLADMEQEGLSPLVCSAYRTWEKQTNLFNNQLNKQRAQGLSAAEAAGAASAIVAAPGTSEHQLGLAVDIVSLEYQTLDDGQERTLEFQWLQKHCWEYGFILRYPPKLSHRTGVIYEPWHYRYVGPEAAWAIMSQGICLEDYLGV